MGDLKINSVTPTNIILDYIPVPTVFCGIDTVYTHHIPVSGLYQLQLQLQ